MKWYKMNQRPKNHLKYGITEKGSILIIDKNGNILKGWIDLDGKTFCTDRKYGEYAVWGYKKDLLKEAGIDEINQEVENF